MVQEVRPNWFKKHPIWTTAIVIVVVFFSLMIIAVNSEDSQPKSSGLKLVDNEGNVAQTTPDSSSASSNSKYTSSQIDKMGHSAKLDLCTKLCAGEDIEIPATKNSCYSLCYQIYYYEGEQGLADDIKKSLNITS